MLVNDVSKATGMHADHYMEVYPDDSLQMTILQEECAELIQAISKLKRNKSNSRKMIVEEMTHVLISIDIVANILDICPYEIISEVYRKESQLVSVTQKNKEEEKND